MGGFGSAAVPRCAKVGPMRRDCQYGLWARRFIAYSPPSRGVGVIPHRVHGIAVAEKYRGQYLGHSKIHLVAIRSNVIVPLFNLLLDLAVDIHQPELAKI
jgi:hypothetical protein